MHRRGLFVNTGAGYVSSESPSDDVAISALFKNDSDSDDGMAFNHAIFKNHVATTYSAPVAPVTEVPEDTGPDEYQDERKKYLVPGLVGLKNLGNTCYM